MLAKWLAGSDWAMPSVAACARWARRHAPGSKTHKLVQQLMSEMHPNGGGSLRDAIDRIDQRSRCLEEQLSLVRLKLRVSGIFDTKPAFAADKDGKFTWVSPAYEEIVETPLLSVLGDGWINGVHQDDRDKVFYSWRFAVKHSTDFHMVFTHCGTKTQRCIRMRVDAYAARDDHDGTCAGWIGVMARLDD